MNAISEGHAYPCDLPLSVAGGISVLPDSRKVHKDKESQNRDH